MFRRLSEQDHYQVLEVRYDASPEEIQSAYEDAREIFSREALVSASILSEPERRRTYERIAEAYQTLIAEESRRLYDESLGIPVRSHPRFRAAERREPPLVLSSPLNPLDPAVLSEVEAAPQAAVPVPAPPVEKPAPRQNSLQLGLTEEATGDFLRQAREALGLDLNTISRETKIGCSMLEYIESERIDRLPAPVYLRNFTLQIARCLGLDEEKVARTYLARIRRHQTHS